MRREGGCLLFKLDMGKKAKKVAKAEIEDEEEVLDVKKQEEIKPAKGKKGDKKSSFDLADIFSESFRERLTQYISLNSEVLTLKGEAEGSDQTEEISQRKAAMAEKVEGSAGTILKEELGSLQEWIKDEQAKLQTSISQVAQAFTDSKRSLVSTGFFGSEEVEEKLSFVKSKQAEMQGAYDNYSSLLERSNNIYN